MTRSLSRLAPLAALAVSLPALRLLLVSNYFVADDSLLHLYRLVELDASLRSGDLFPRWSPDLALGYGYPLFNYYPPLAYYLAEAFHLLGLGFGAALRATLGAGLALSGLGMYLFVVDVFRSRPAALVSATAFVYFPYHLTDLYVRGAIPEATFIALLPYALFTFHRLAKRVSPGYVILGALLVASLILSHVISLFFLPLLAGYAVVNALSLPRQRRRAVLLSAAAFGLGAALTAFYWLPVLLERQFVAVVNADWLKGEALRGEFLALNSLVDWRLAFDYKAKFPPKPALVDLLLATGGLGVWLAGRNRRELLPALVPFLVVTPVLLLLLGEPSLPFWQRLPLVSFIQFPWRLLAFVGLATSILAGLLARTGKLALPLMAIICPAVVFVSTWELGSKPLEYEDRSLALSSLARYEYNSGVLGTAYGNEWLPVTVRPDFTSPVYLTVSPPEADDTEAVTILGFRRTGPLSYTAKVIAGGRGRLRLHSFYFPGWQARVDGAAVATYPSTDLGIVTFDVSEGQHDVSLSFQDTGVRTTGRMLSLAALVAIGLALTVPRPKGTRHPAGPAPGREGKTPSPRWVGVRAPWMDLKSFRPRRGDLALAAASLPILVAGVAVVQPSLPSVPATGGSSTPVDFATPGGDRLRLLAYEPGELIADGDGRVSLTLYWQTLQPGGSDLRMALEAVDGEGNLVARQVGSPIYSTASTSGWSVNEIVRDRREIWLTEGSSPAPVFLRIGVPSGEKLLGSVQLGVVRSHSLTSRGTPIRMERHGTVFGDKLLLLGYAAQTPLDPQPRRTLGNLAKILVPAATVPVTLFWQALSPLEEDYVVSLRLVGASGELIAYHDSQPQAGFRPTSLWQAGETVEDVHRLDRPSIARPGTHELEVSLYQPHSGEKLRPRQGQSPNFKLGPMELRR